MYEWRYTVTMLEIFARENLAVAKKKTDPLTALWKSDVNTTGRKGRLVLAQSTSECYGAQAMNRCHDAVTFDGTSEQVFIP